MYSIARFEDGGIRFRPKTPTEFFAFQLARRLNDTGNLARYIAITEYYQDDEILRAMRGLEKGAGEAGIDLLEAELGRVSNRASYGEQ